MARCNIFFDLFQHYFSYELRDHHAILVLVPLRNLWHKAMKTRLITRRKISVRFMAFCHFVIMSQSSLNSIIPSLSNVFLESKISGIHAVKVWLTGLRGKWLQGKAFKGRCDLYSIFTSFTINAPLEVC